MSLACPDIKPAFPERNVPVALATDAKYLPYVAVSINSLAAHSAGSNLDIIVLYSGIKDEEIQAFSARYAELSNVSVRFVDVSESVGGSVLADFRHVDRLPASACYRLLLPNILKAYDKLIYFDVDVVVCSDIGELYATDVSDCYFAAAKDIVHSNSPEYLSWAASWGFTEWDAYVNTGVLVMNLERFRREPIIDKLLTVAVEASKYLCDQDALNFVCKGAIAPLDPRWNVQLGNYCLKEQIALTGDEMWAVHFTSAQKPWAFPVRRYSHLWWLHVDASDIPRLWEQALGDAFVPSDDGAPKLSVIMSVYNAAKYLPQALASVLCQKDFPDLELVCVDDASTDDSAAILEFWHNRDPRLQILRQANQGPGVARNTGMDVAKGEYICFLDADDRIAPGDALLRAYEQAKRDGLDILLAASSTIAEDGQILEADARINYDVIPQEPVFAPDALGAWLFLCTPLAPWGKLYRRAFLENNKLRFPALKRSEDFPMIGEALAIASRIGAFRRSFCEHRIGVDSSLESTKDETPLVFFEAEHLLRSSLRKHKLWSRFKTAAYSAFLSSLAYNLRAVRSYPSFRAIIAKYRQEHRQWICWEHVDLPDCFAGKVQLVKDIEADLNDDEQIALFVKLREAAAKNAPEIRRLRFDNKRLAALIAAEKAKVLRRDKWLATEKDKVERAEAKVARRDEWLEAEKKKAERAEAKLSAEKAKVEAVSAKLARRDEWLEAEKKKAERAEAKLNAEKAKVEAVNAKLARRDEWLEAEKKKAERAEAKLAVAAEKVEAVNAKLARRDEWLAAEQKKAERAEARLNAEKAKVEAVNAKLARRDEWLAAEQKKVERAEAKLAVAVAKVEAVNAKLARRDEWLAAEKKKTERAEAKLNAEKAKVEAANAKLVRRDEWLAGEKAKSAKLQSQLEAEKRRSADYAAENRRNGVELARLRKESQLLSKVEAAIFGEPAAAKK